MNNSSNTKTFARSWKIAEVTPVLKSGDSEEPCNNRPISLLPVLSKVSEHLAGKEITPVTVAKDLGTCIYIDQSLTYNDHIIKNRFQLPTQADSNKQNQAPIRSEDINFTYELFYF